MNEYNNFFLLIRKNSKITFYLTNLSENNLIYLKNFFYKSQRNPAILAKSKIIKKKGFQLNLIKIIDFTRAILKIIKNLEEELKLTPKEGFLKEFLKIIKKATEFIIIRIKRSTKVIFKIILKMEKENELELMEIRI